MACWEVQERLGGPEGELGLAQAIVYLAVALKSNAVYTAFYTVPSVVGEKAVHYACWHRYRVSDWQGIECPSGHPAYRQLYSEL